MGRLARTRRFWLSTTAAATLAAAGAAPALADPSTSTLVQLLAQKGVITATEARTVTAAPASTQQERLVALLRDKGILGAADVKALGGMTAMRAPEPAAAAATPPVAPPLRVATLDPNVLASAAPALHGDLKSYPPMVTKSPLAVDVAGITLTPLGFIDVTGVWRSRNTGNSMATSFGAIPFDNTIQGNLGETRLSAQNSRIALRAEGTYFDQLHLLGYLEGDFNGNDPANVFVTSNSHTLRLRQAFMDVAWGNWEFVGGQAYSWMTPNRHGLSPYPTDVFTTLNIDQNLQVGLPWTRAAQARLVYHATNEFQLGVAVENPEQFIGAGEVIFPFAFNAQLGTQFDANNNPGTPNVAPDIIAKGAYDTNAYGHNIHLEAAGLVRQFKATTIAIGGSEFTSHETTGWGVSVAGNVEVVHGFNLVGNAFWSQGGGRYLTGLGPDLVVALNAAGTDIELSTVESSAFLAGAEWWLNPDTVIAGYYGFTRFKPNAFEDTTNPVPGRIAGFGGLNSPNSANGKIQEATFDVRHTFWSHPRFGALEGLAQYSWVKREPNFVPAGAPDSADIHMFFASMRYHLPGGPIE